MLNIEQSWLIPPMISFVLWLTSNVSGRQFAVLLIYKSSASLFEHIQGLQALLKLLVHIGTMCTSELY